MNEENTKKQTTTGASNFVGQDPRDESKPAYLEAPNQSDENRACKLVLVAPWKKVGMIFY
jgi:hypothetical protein